jgi:hypothetical protein
MERRLIMQKKTKKILNIEITETLLDFFIRNTEADVSIKNIINVLSVLNSNILLHPGSKRTEIFDFGNYFIANGYESRTRKAREKEYGQEALVMNRYYEIAAEIERKEIQEALCELSHSDRYEAMTLTDTVFKIKEENITVTLSIEDGPVEFRYDKSSKQHYDILKNEFFEYMCYAIKLGTAGVVIRIKKKPKDWLLGIKIEGGIWRPLPVYEFIEEYVEGLDLSVRYTELTRKYE